MATPEDARALVERLFVAGERVEVGPLAAELRVSRVTLYRWLGSREELLGELLWSRLERGLARADKQAERDGRVGTDRLATVLLGIFTAAGASSPERVFAERETPLAMRLMTTGKVHERLIAWVAAAIAHEAAAGRIAPRHPAAQIAEIVVRSGEAVFWFDLASGRGVSQDNLAVILTALCPPGAD